MSLIVRWQIGSFPEPSWRALRLSVVLMSRLLPDAHLVIIHQGTIHPVCQLPGVTYHGQENLYSHGRFERPHAAWFDGTQHELTIENDHIMWTIPPGMQRWLARDDATLAWIVDWDYYGNYAGRVGDFRACPGMYGLPPGVMMPAPPAEERGDDQAEQGYVASWLREHPPHEIITHDEIAAYMPNHDILKHTHSKLGTHGVHLPGLNRGWSPDGEKLIAELERKYL
jgi:hypothetical protein